MKSEVWKSLKFGSGGGCDCGLRAWNFRHSEVSVRCRIGTSDGNFHIENATMRGCLDEFLIFCKRLWIYPGLYASFSMGVEPRNDLGLQHTVSEHLTLSPIPLSCSSFWS